MNSDGSLNSDQDLIKAQRKLVSDPLYELKRVLHFKRRLKSKIQNINGDGIQAGDGAGLIKIEIVGSIP